MGKMQEDVERIVQAFRNEIEPLKDKVDRMKERMIGLNKRMGGFDKTMDQLGGCMVDLESRMFLIEHKMDQLEEKMDLLLSHMKSENRNACRVDRIAIEMEPQPISQAKLSRRKKSTYRGLWMIRFGQRLYDKIKVKNEDS